MRHTHVVSLSLRALFFLVVGFDVETGESVYEIHILRDARVEQRLWETATNVEQNDCVYQEYRELNQLDN